MIDTPDWGRKDNINCKKRAKHVKIGGSRAQFRRNWDRAKTAFPKMAGFPLYCSSTHRIAWGREKKKIGWLKDWKVCVSGAGRSPSVSLGGPRGARLIVPNVAQHLQPFSTSLLRTHGRNCNLGPLDASWCVPKFTFLFVNICCNPRPHRCAWIDLDVFPRNEDVAAPMSRVIQGRGNQ